MRVISATLIAILLALLVAETRAGWGLFPCWIAGKKFDDANGFTLARDDFLG